MRESEDLEEQQGDEDEGPAPAPSRAATGTRTIVDVALDKIDESPTNTRRTWGDLDELSKSIAAVGVLEPLLARPSPKKRGRFELVFGHRRFRAGKLAKVATLPLIIRDLTDAQAVEIQVVENLQRTDIHPLEEAEGYEQLMKIGKVTAEEIAVRVGKSRSYVFGRLKLLALCEKVRKAFAKDEISASVALYIARIPSPKLQVDALEAVTDYDGNILSARDAKAEIEEHFMLRLDEAPFDREDTTLVPKAGACGTCPKRTGNQAVLFEDVKSGDVCTDTECFSAKKHAHGKRRLQLAAEKGQAVLVGKAADDALRHGSKLVKLDEKNYDDPKYRTNRSIIKGSKAEVTLAKDDDGNVHELVSRAAVTNLLPKSAKAESSSMSDEDKKRRQAAARKRVRTCAVMGAVVAAAEKKVEGHAFWTFLADVLLDNVDHDDASEICKRRGIDVDKKRYRQPDAALKTAFAKMTVEQAKGLAIELAAAPGSYRFSSWGSKELGTKLVAAAEHYKVDAKKIGDAAIAEAKASKPAPKKPAKKATPARGAR